MNASYHAIALHPVVPSATANTVVLGLRRRPAATEPPPIPDDALEVVEARLLAILDAPLCARETPTAGFDRKECALGDAFAELTWAQARALLARLEVNYTCDPLARKFHTLNEERRERLMGFLGRCAE